ncbi:MAG: hypothetical protein AAGH15_05900 [Myxococcota bacterium]
MGLEGLNRDLADLLLLLDEHGADFVVIGGWALAVHGHLRGTDDLDIFVRATPANGDRIYAALVAFGAPVRAHEVGADLFSSPGYGYRFGIKPQLAEILTSIDGTDFDAVARDAITVHLEGRSIRVASKRALLRTKRAAGRPKDLADVAWLEAHADDEDIGQGQP